MRFSLGFASAPVVPTFLTGVPVHTRIARRPLTVRAQPKRRAVLRACADAGGDPSTSTSTTSTSTTTSSSPDLHDVESVKVTSSTGEKAPRVSVKDTVDVTSASIELPTGAVTALDVTTQRAATAVVWGPASIGNAASANSWLSGAKVVVFTHGFSQRPANYASTLARLAVLGYVVLAPRVWFISVAPPWVSVVDTTDDGADGATGLPRKLQTALLVDGARCVQIAQDGGASELHLLGHSMGGASALALLPYYVASSTAGTGTGGASSLLTVTSAAVMAPAVEVSVCTGLNPYSCGKDAKTYSGLATAVPDTPVFILQGAADKIVPAAQTQTFYNALKVRAGLTGEAVLDGGTHVGFEDQLDIVFNLPIPCLVSVIDTLFMVVDFIFFGVVDSRGRNAQKQLKRTKKLVEAWFSSAGISSNAVVIANMNTAEGKGDDTLEFSE